MAKRRKKRTHEVSKRCHCPDQSTCSHHWFLRVHTNGQRQRIDLTERFPGEAVDVAAARAKDLARKGQLFDVPPTDARLTFGDIADRYIAAYPDRSHHYLAGVRVLDVPAANGATVTLESKSADDVTAADIKHLVKLWRSRPRTKAGVKHGAVAERHLLQTLRHTFNWAIAEGFATHTPFKSAQGVNMIKVKASKGRSRRLEAGEADKILDVANGYIKDFFNAMIETGCRPGELRQLQWSEVRSDEIVVLAHKAKDREERRIPIMPALAKILARRKLGPDGRELAPDRYVFGNEVGEVVARRRLCTLWNDTLTRAGVTDLHLHDLRAEAASQLSEAGASDKDVRDALGHSNTSMTSAYLRSRRTSLRDAYAKRARKALRLARVGQSTKQAKSS
jgi:integrase